LKSVETGEIVGDASGGSGREFREAVCGVDGDAFNSIKVFRHQGGGGEANDGVKCFPDKAHDNAKLMMKNRLNYVFGCRCGLLDCRGNRSAVDPKRALASELA